MYRSLTGNQPHSGGTVQANAILLSLSLIILVLLNVNRTLSMTKSCHPLIPAKGNLNWK